jgi:hypothetical protein
MNSTPTIPSGNGKQIASPALRPSSPVQGAKRAMNKTLAPTQPDTKRTGYGLPCANCKTYYAADLTACPICKNTERVSPVAASASASLSSSEQVPDLVSDDAILEEERERFLREFKSQVYASHLQINAASSFRCSREEIHQGGFEPAAVCQGCHDHLQQHADVMEAALHMDPKEAAQVIYDAVWSDPSDPSKTYQNAAQALLTELRKRAGISMVMGPLQPLPH